MLGLDLATTSGWALIEDEKIIEMGTIDIDSRMALIQRLNFLSLELERLFTRLKPDRCAIEDVLLGISGVKVLSYLARINGVALLVSYKHVSDNITLYQPTHWKANSFPGLEPFAKKWQIQKAACDFFNISYDSELEKMERTIEKYEKIINGKIEITTDNKKLIDSTKAALKRKTRDVLKGSSRTMATTQMKSLIQNNKDLKKEIKISKLEFDKEMRKVGIDIAAKTGLTDNIADACGVALCAIKEITNESNN